VETLSRFLTGKDNGIETFLAKFDNKDQKKPRLDIIFRILDNSRKWTVQSFGKHHIQISKNGLSHLKGIVAYEVFKWVEGDEYSTSYMQKRLSRKVWRIKGPDNLWPEYGLVKALWLASVYHEENPELNFKDILKAEFFGKQLLKADRMKKVVSQTTLTSKKIKLNADGEKIKCEYCKSNFLDIIRHLQK